MKARSMIVGLLLMFVLSGFGYAAEPITLGYGAPTGSTDWKTVKMFFPAFEAQYPDIKMKDVGYPRQGYEERLLTQFAAKSSEVDFFTEWASGEEFMDREFVIPLDGSLDPSIKASDELLKKVYPHLLKMFTYPQFPMPGRSPKLYMMPINSSDAMLLLYREDLIKQAGLPGPPKNWDERIAYGRKLTRDITGSGVIDIYGDAFFASRKIMMGKEIVNSFYNALLTAGGQYLDAKGMPAFNSEAGVKGLQFLCDLKNKYKTVPPGLLTYTYADIRDLMGSGKLAMAENWTAAWIWADGDPASQARGKLGVAPIPYLVKPGSYTHAGALAIPKASKHPKEAWLFIKYMMLESVQTLFHLTLLDHTSLPSVVRSPEVQAFLSPRNQRMLETYDQVARNSSPLPLFRGSSKVIRVLGEQLERAYSQQVTPKEALDLAASEARKIIQEELRQK